MYCELRTKCVISIAINVIWNRRVFAVISPHFTNTTIIYTEIYYYINMKRCILCYQSLETVCFLLVELTTIAFTVHTLSCAKMAYDDEHNIALVDLDGCWMKLDLVNNTIHRK